MRESSQKPMQEASLLIADTAHPGVLVSKRMYNGCRTSRQNISRMGASSRNSTFVCVFQLINLFSLELSSGDSVGHMLVFTMALRLRHFVISRNKSSLPDHGRKFGTHLPLRMHPEQRLAHLRTPTSKCSIVKRLVEPVFVAQCRSLREWVHRRRPSSITCPELLESNEERSRHVCRVVDVFEGIIGVAVIVHRTSPDVLGG